MKKKILFICKKRIHSYGNTYGLYNSALMVANMLNANGIESKVELVIDNNCIDRVVTEYNPTHVIIEALWVVPSKFPVLLSLPRHKKRIWNVRLHSKTPFLAMEGIAMKWLHEYAKLSKQFANFFVSANTCELESDLNVIFDIHCIYQPNVYPLKDESLWDVFKKGLRSRTPILDIGCYGAIRPLKNQLIQAAAAIDFANEIRKPLRFHINSERVEQRGDEVLKNLRAMFDVDPQYTLVEHPWLPHDLFLQLVQQMDIGMQVSYTETFNIVAADFVSQNIPVIASSEMEWMSSRYQVDCNHRELIVDGLRRAYNGLRCSLQTLNYMSLRKYNQRATAVWLNDALV